MNNVHPLSYHGTNSTLFTACCDVAITQNQPRCPHCGEKVIGADAETDHQTRIERGF